MLFRSPYMNAHVRPFALAAEVERALKPGANFHECDKNCPEMVVVPAGSFIMGSPESEKGHDQRESPQHQVTIARPFAVSKYLVTFDDWDACVSVGGCPHNEDSNGRGTMPAINGIRKRGDIQLHLFSAPTACLNRRL